MALTLDQASTIVDTALATARKENMNPLTVVVFDAGGHLKCVKREDGCGILRVEVASGKAYGALGMGISSRKLRDNLVEARIEKFSCCIRVYLYFFYFNLAAFWNVIQYRTVFYFF